jgi:integrase
MCSQAQIRLYCYKKSEAAINREVRAGNHYFVANLNKPKGYNQIKSFGQMLARRAGLVDWVRCTNHCWRAFGITRMSNSSMVSLTEAMGAARHTSATAHQAYVRTDGVSEQNRIMAMSDVAYR